VAKDLPAEPSTEKARSATRANYYPLSTKYIHLFSLFQVNLQAEIPACDVEEQKASDRQSTDIDSSKNSDLKIFIFLEFLDVHSSNQLT
jgi:hypothetical protein